jgi:hypothetical protein
MITKEKGVHHRISSVIHSLTDSMEAFELGEEPEDVDDPKDTKELCIAESSCPSVHDFEKEGHELNTDNEAVKPDREVHGSIPSLSLFPAVCNC